MKEELIFHGVPRGYDVWGGSPDKYFDSFYGSPEIYKDADPLMVLEIRKSENRFFSYYTFLKYKNINAVDNRPGSYFGMTFKAEGKYCTAVSTLYNLFFQIYEKYIKNTIIKKEGDSGVYLLSSFESAASSLKEISKVFFEQLSGNFHDDFEDLSQNISKKNAERNLYYNIDDIDSSAFFNASMNYGKILISAGYPAKDEIVEKYQKNQSRIKEYKASLEQLAEQNKIIPQLQGRIQKLQSEIREKENSLKSEYEKNTVLVRRVKEVERELTDYKSIAEIKERVSEIKRPICELSDILRDKIQDNNLSFPQRVSSKIRQGRSIRSNLEIMIMAVMVLLMAFLILIYLKLL